MVERLRHAGYEVLVTSRQAAPDVVRVCDLLQPRQLDELLADCQPDWVLSFAGIPRHDPDGAVKLHSNGTGHLLEATARHCPQARIILMGSAAEYGRVPEGRLPIREDFPPGPNSPLGQSKLAQTQIAQIAAIHWGLDIVSLRPFNIVGPGQPAHYLAGALIRRLVALRNAGRNEPISVASGDSTRDFIDVRDVADAIVSVVRGLPAETGRLRVFNVSTGQETSVRQLAKQICALAGGYELIDAQIPSSGGEIDRSCGDSRKLEDAVGWRALTGWRESLSDAWRETIADFELTTTYRPAA